MPKFKSRPIEWKAVEGPLPTECWVCISHGCKSNTYPEVKRNGHRFFHHYMYATYVGPIPNELFVLHKCDNIKCGRPEHLYIGTKKDNMVDAVERGRLKRYKDKQWHEIYDGKFPKGESCPWSKLTELQVKEIKLSNKSYRSITREYNVAFNTIWGIKNNRTWTHIKV